MKKSGILIVMILLSLCLNGCGNRGSDTYQDKYTGQETASQPTETVSVDTSSFTFTNDSIAESEKEMKRKMAENETVIFGHYEQDNDLDNGPEPIEWIVLDVQDGKALLLSKYGLDKKSYNKTWDDITWENCTLRAWLNDDFLNAAFSETELLAILLTDVDNSDAQGYSGWFYTKEKIPTGGNNTQDQIFLLSYAEANRYLDVQYRGEEGADQNMKSRVAPTAYAIAKRAYRSKENRTTDGERAGWWWLRSPGSDQDCPAIVSGYGLAL